MNRKLILTMIITILLTSNSVIVLANFENKSSEKKEWTYMMYFGGDQEWEWKEAEKIVDISMNLSIFLNNKINVVCLVDFGEAFYGYAKHFRNFRANFHILEKYDEINCGNYSTLKDFVVRCKKDYPAERYFLHIHGHGSAWYGACPDTDTNESGVDHDILTMQEIHKALDESGGVNILEFTNCYMGNLESAYELRNCTKVYIGSEEACETFTPAITLLYNIKILQRNYYKSSMKIAEKIINQFKRGLFYMYRFTPIYLFKGLAESLKNFQKFNSYYIMNSFTMSAIETEKLGEVGESINVLSTAMISDLENCRHFINNTRFHSDYFMGSTSSNAALIDIYHFAKLLNEKAYEISNSDFCNATDRVMKSIDEAVIAEWHQCGHKNAHGLTIFFPPDKSEIFFPPSSNKLNMQNYTVLDLEFTNDTQWDEFLELYLN